MGSRWDQHQERINSLKKINDLAQELQPAPKAANTATRSTTNTTTKNTTTIKHLAYATTV